MSEMWLGFKGRMGHSSVKALAVFGLLLAGILGCLAVSSVFTAINNPAEPVDVSLADLVSGAVKTGRYVRVSGYTNSRAAYEYTQDGKVTDTYYFLADRNVGDVVLVKADTPTLAGRKAGTVTITGMTRGVSGELATRLKKDMPDIEKAGLQVNAQIYISEGQKPPSLFGSLCGTLGFSLLGLLSVMPFFFPGVVFRPCPLPADVVPPSPDARVAVQASGLFLRLKQVQPTVETGKGMRQFDRAVANIIPHPDRSLLIYIHHIMRTKTYGVTVHTSVTDWGIFLDHNKVQSVEAGKLYGWGNRWAIRVRYLGVKGKPITLVLSFDQPWMQVVTVQLFRQLGFEVDTGEAIA